MAEKIYDIWARRNPSWEKRYEESVIKAFCDYGKGATSLGSAKGKLFGKPKNREEAKYMLKTLSGKWHKVITSLCVNVSRNGEQKKYLTYDICKVKFLKLTDEEIDKYLDCGEYKDKAGAYAIQGKSGMFIEKIYGSYATVIGLPTHLLYQILKKENEV